jgi:Ca2+-transporting ATPase
MSLAKIFVLATQEYLIPAEYSNDQGNQLIRMAMWASEPIPFDPMEISLHDAYTKSNSSDERSEYQIIQEYPLGGKPPMMTHVFENNAGARIVAAKGAPEALVAISDLTSPERQHVEHAIEALTREGFRVLGVGEAKFSGNDFPKTQQEFKFHFKGILAFYDPPKKNIPSVLNDFYKAGIVVKIITGDNAETTSSIAKQIGLRGFEKNITGDELMQLTETALKKKVEETFLFTRMFPEAKLKIINSLKANNEIVAMTGDGVNDGPALKAAHIGIAMGRKGTEIAKEAASLILLEDDLSKMVDAVAIGRKIYSNLKKAIQYIISIHIPIILTVFLPLALGWIYPNIFSPVHIIFLELIMGPTCSIIYENEPMEKNIMNQRPRPLSSTFFDRKELMTSFFQGLMITVGTLSIYQYAIQHGYNANLTRTMVFATIISANIFLTLVNRSFYYSLFSTMKYKNNLVLMIICITIALTGFLIFIPPLSRFFLFEPLSLVQLLISTSAGCLSAIWYELIKWRKRQKEVEGS